MMNFRSLGVKIDIIIAVIMIIVFVGVFSLISYQVYQLQVNSVEKTALAESKNLATSVHEVYLQSYQSGKDISERINSLLNASQVRSREEVVQILEQAMRSNDKIFGATVCFEPDAFDGRDSEYVNKPYHDATGRFIPYVSRNGSSLEVTPLVDYDKAETIWYTAPKKLNKTVITNPYPYELNGKVLRLSTLSMPFKDASGKFIGVLGVDIDVTSLQAMVQSTKVDGGYACIIAGDGYIVAHGLKSDLISKNLIDIDKSFGDTVAKIAKGESVILKQKSLATGELTMKVFAPIHFDGTDSNWSFVSVIPYSVFLKGFYDTMKILIALAIIAVIITLVILAFVMKQTAITPIVELSEIIDRLAKYNFVFDKNSKAVNYIKRRDEIGTITRSLAAMQQNITSLVGDITNGSKSVAVTSEELTATANQAAKASEEISKTIEEIAMGASDQAKDTEKAALKADEMGVVLENVGRLMMELNKSVEEIDKQKEAGFEILENLIEKTKANSDASVSVYEVVLGTNENAAKIETASQMIQSIADQTNLLALNAAIEAARAGEAGRGFAVVADEIRKLAEQSTKFTDEIKKVIQELKNKSQNAVGIMTQAKQIVEEQAESVNGTEEKFDMIAKAIAYTKDVIHKLNQLASDMNDKKSEMISLVENLSAIAQENAAGTEEASASIEEQAASIEEMANASSGLAKIAEDLQVLIDRFEI